jgi:hypothetical protein
VLCAPPEPELTSRAASSARSSAATFTAVRDSTRPTWSFGTASTSTREENPAMPPPRSTPTACSATTKKVRLAPIPGGFVQQHAVRGRALELAAVVVCSSPTAASRGSTSTSTRRRCPARERDPPSRSPCGLAPACVSNGSLRPPPLPSREQPDALYPGDDGRVFYPERSIACDRATQICYSGGKPSLGATERYLGEDAARDLKRRSVDQQAEPKWIFEPDGQTSCDMRTQVCYSVKGPSVNKTRKYFGDAARRGSSSDGGRPRRRVEEGRLRCQRADLHDENGPSVKLTRKYFGEEAAKRLKKQIPH